MNKQLLLGDLQSEDIKYLLLNLQEPLVLRNKLDWELLKWNLKDWERILKDETLTFRCGKNMFTKEPQWERYTEIVKTTFKEFLTMSQDNENWMYFDYKYLKDWLNNKEELTNNIDWSSFGFPELSSRDCTIWIGSKGAHTPCHIDTYGWNMVAQIYGRKAWLLFPPEENLKPSRVPYEESSIYSKLNFFTPNINDFKGIANGRKIILNPGDVLFVPHKWWHYVENLETAISINVWMPSPTDDEERLTESLVQLFLSQVIKNCEATVTNSILNPNSEEELKNLTFSDSVSLTHNCKCTLTKCNKKMRPNEQPSVKLPWKEKKLIEIFEKYSFIHEIPKLSADELNLWLEKQSHRFTKEKNMVEDSKDYNKVQEVIDIVNAFSHPEVLTLIKDKLLEQMNL